MLGKVASDVACYVQGGDRRVAELIGINKAHLQKLITGGQRRSVSDSEKENMRVCKRFWVALILNDIIQEVPSTLAFSPFLFYPQP